LSQSPGMPRQIGFPLSLFLLALSLVYQPVVAADTCPDVDPEAVIWLDRMSRSGNQISYQGVVTLQRGDEMRVMQLSHSVDGSASSEYLTQLNGQGARIEREQHPLHCIHPGHKLLRLGDSVKQGDCGVARHYRLRMAEGERIAGRHAVRVLVQPRDMYRYGYALDLDRETALLLKARVVGANNQTLEQFQFANLSYQDDRVEVPQVEIVHEAHHPMPGVNLDDTPLKRDWTVRFLPGGFMPTDTVVGGSRRTYTDGLAVFSVFLEELREGIRPGEGVVRQGSTLSYTRGMQLGGTPILVTVIGEVPPNTARLVADSVSWTQ
jgi:sigma-E factor negative regulatory protein RseB